jgi:hypothetical protein
LIDTLKIWFDLNQPLDCDIIINSNSFRGKSNCIYKDSIFQVLPIGHENNPARISVQASLPKIIHGHNVVPLDLEETGQAMKILLTKVSESIKLPEVPAMDVCHVSRADFVYDWIVDSPEAYISVLNKFAMVRGNHSLMVWKNGQDKGTTIKSGSSQQKLIAYNKEAEVAFRSKTGFVSQSEQDLAKGRIRVEYGVQRRAWIRVLGKTSPTMAELDSYLSLNGSNALAQKLTNFTDGWGDSSLEDAIVKLNEVHGPTRGRQLSGTFALVRSLGVNNYKQICSPSASTWYQFRHALRAADVSLTDSDGLEPLVIPPFNP